MQYFPINLNINGRLCLVVGGGEVGQRKVAALLEYGARVALVSRELTRTLAGLVESGNIVFLGEEFKPALLDGAALVIAATSEPGLNQNISAEARRRGIPVNVADVPELCDFIFPATVKQGDLIISVSTSGRSPALAGRIRRRLEREFGPEYSLFLTLMGLIRTRVKLDGQISGVNKRTFIRLLDSDILALLARNDFINAEKRLVEILGQEYSFKNLGFEPNAEL